MIRCPPGLKSDQAFSSSLLSSLMCSSTSIYKIVSNLLMRFVGSDWRYPLNVFSLIFLFFSEQLVLLFNNEPEFIDTVLQYSVWMAIISLTAFPAFLWDGIYVATTSIYGLFLTMLISAICFFSIFFVLKDQYTNNALWFSICAFFIIRGLLQTSLYNLVIHKKIKSNS